MEVIENVDDEEDFSKDEVILKHVNPNRYISLDVGGFRILRLNWVVSGLASIVLWGLVVYCINEGTTASTEFGKWQS